MYVPVPVRLPSLKAVCVCVVLRCEHFVVVMSRTAMVDVAVCECQGALAVPLVLAVLHGVCECECECETRVVGQNWGCYFIYIF